MHAYQLVISLLPVWKYNFLSCHYGTKPIAIVIIQFLYDSILVHFPFQPMSEQLCPSKSREMIADVTHIISHKVTW